MTFSFNSITIIDRVVSTNRNIDLYGQDREQTLNSRKLTALISSVATVVRTEYLKLKRMKRISLPGSNMKVVRKTVAETITLPMIIRMDRGHLAISGEVA